MIGDRIRAPFSGLVAREEFEADARLHVVGAVVLAQPENRRGGAATGVNSVQLRYAGWHVAQLGGERRVESHPLRRPQLDERVVRCLRHGSPHRRAVWRRVDIRVALIATDDRVHRVEDRNLNDRERQRGACRTHLLAKDPGLTGRNRRVIDRVRIRHHFVPVEDRVHGVGTTADFGCARTRQQLLCGRASIRIARSPELVQAAEQPVGRHLGDQTEHQHRPGDLNDQLPTAPTGHRSSSTTQQRRPSSASA